MTGESHLEIGIATSAAVITCLPMENDFYSLLIAVLGVGVGGIMALVPDVDAPHHKLRGVVKRSLGKLFLFQTDRIVRGWLTLSRRRKKARDGDWLRYLLYPFCYILVFLWSLPGRFLVIVADALFDLIPSFLTHRRETHSLFAIVVVTVFCVGLAWCFPVAMPVFVGAAVGYASHIVADCLTVSGVQFWWPLNLKSFHLSPKRWRIHTGEGLRRYKMGTSWICFPTERQIAIVWMILGVSPFIFRLLSYLFVVQ